MPSTCAAGSSEAPAGFLIGGYFGGWVAPDVAADLRLSRAGLAGVGGSLGAGVLLALPASACPLQEVSRVVGWLAEQSAGQCGPCRFGLPVDRRRLSTRSPAAGFRPPGTAGSSDGRARSPAAAPATIRTAPLASSPARLRTFHGEVTLHSSGRCSAPGDRLRSARFPRSAAPAARTWPVPMSRRAGRPRLRVDPIACTGFGLCAELFPEGVALDDWGYPLLAGDAEVPPAALAHARRAVKACPTLALRLERGRVTHDGPPSERSGGIA